MAHARNVPIVYTPPGRDWPFAVAVVALAVSLVSGQYAIWLPVLHFFARAGESWLLPTVPWWPGIAGAGVTAAASAIGLVGGLRRRGKRRRWTTALAVAGLILSAGGIMVGLLLAARLISALPPP